jgi:hypothetical protein
MGRWPRDELGHGVVLERKLGATSRGAAALASTWSSSGASMRRRAARPRSRNALIGADKGSCL